MGAQTTTFVFEAGFPPSPYEIDPNDIENRVIDFLELYADEPLVDARFNSLIGEGDGDSRFARLLGAAQLGGNPTAFFDELLDQLKHANG